MCHTVRQTTALNGSPQIASVQLPLKMTPVQEHALATKEASTHTIASPSTWASRSPVNGVQHKVARTEEAHSWTHCRRKSGEKVTAAVSYAKCRMHMSAVRADVELYSTGTPSRSGACTAFRRAANDDSGTPIRDVSDTATGKARPRRRPPTWFLTGKGSAP